MAIWPLALIGCLPTDECRGGTSPRAVAYGSSLEAGNVTLPLVKIPLLGWLLGPGALVGSAVLEWLRSVFP